MCIIHYMYPFFIVDMLMPVYCGLLFILDLKFKSIKYTYSGTCYFTYLMAKLNLFHVLCVFFSGLKNDHIAESFFLKHEIDNNYFPCRYVKIGKVVAYICTLYRCRGLEASKHILMFTINS